MGLMADISKGTRFQVVNDVETDGLVHWRAPFTSGFHCIIPKGTILVSFGDSVSSSAVGLVPEDYKEFEQKFIPESDRTADNYAGYSLVFTRAEVRKRLRPL
jgi:hypothetical protein